MAKSQEEIVRIFFNHLSKSSYDDAKVFMEKQRLVNLNNVWPKAMFDILCDFALAEKNYYDTNFEPSKNKMLERKEDENYLDFVYKTLFQDLEKLKSEVDDNYVTKFMTTLLQFISVRLQLLDLYDKLYEIGSLNSWINFSELSETVENIQNDLSNFSPVDQVLRIVRYELDCIQHLFKCHEHLGDWSYFNSLISLKESSDAFIAWEKCYQNQESIEMDFSTEELAIIALLLDADEEKKNQAHRKYWVHPAWNKRETEGEFQTLYKELIDDETKFHGYFRMSMNTFDILLKAVENDLQKQDTNFRKCIPPRHRLAVCLRFLATGDSFKTISYSYRLGHSTVYEIVTNTCEALVKTLMPEVMPIPTSQKWREIADEFWKCWNFPNCIGSLDGKHVVIQAPPNRDEAFPLKTYLMRPYPGKQLDDSSKRVYNYRHCRGRRVVENTFGILTQKFRIFNRRIQAKPENADNIILATCVLHNFIKINEGRITYNREENINPAVDLTLQNIPIQGGNASQPAFQGWRFSKLFTSKSTLPPLLIWFKRFKHMTISKFMLYFYGILIRQSSLREVKNTSEEKNLNFFTKMQQLKQKAEALSAILVYETPDYPSDNDSCNGSSPTPPTSSTPPITKMDPFFKYKVIISYPKVPVKFDVVEKIRINDEENSVNKIEMITDENVTYMFTRVDLKIIFIMCFNGKPKNEEREKASILEFVSMLRCHRYFTSVNR